MGYYLDFCWGKENYLCDFFVMLQVVNAKAELRHFEPGRYFCQMCNQDTDIHNGQIR